MWIDSLLGIPEFPGQNCYLSNERLPLWVNWKHQDSGQSYKRHGGGCFLGDKTKTCPENERAFIEAEREEYTQVLQGRLKPVKT